MNAKNRLYSRKTALSAATFTIAASLLPFSPWIRAEWGGVGGILPPPTPPPLVPASGENDGDGLPDSWEDANYLNKSDPSDQMSDFDQDGLTALQEYELHVQTSGAYGKPTGKWTTTSVPNPTGFVSTPSVTLIECASNGTILARVDGKLTGSTVTTSYPYTYSPATNTWTRVAAPTGYSSVTSLTPLDVNSSGQVVGYFNSSGTKGFLWTPSPSGGTTTVFYLNPWGTPTIAIPKRISDTGYITGNETSLGGRSIAATTEGYEVTFPGTWTNPYYFDVNDYGEFVGQMVNPLTSRSEIFLAVDGGSVYFTGIDGPGISAMMGLELPFPDIDPSEITWDPNSNGGGGGFYDGTAIDRQTNEIVNVRQGYGASFYWRYDIPWHPEWYAYPGFSPSFGGVNDWGEYAGQYNATMYEGYYDSYNYMSGMDTTAENGVFFFDGHYHFDDQSSIALSYPSFYGVANDGRVLMGTPFTLWSGSVSVPITNLIPSGGSTTISAARLGGDGNVVIQRPTSPPLAILKPNQDADNDGMPDDWEKYYGFNPASAADATGDADADGISNLVEFKYRTNPTLLQLPNSTQFIDLRPAVDTDGDGMPNVWEWKNSLSHTYAGDAGEDPDQDGLTNLQEFRLGTDPRKDDTDGDGVSDGDEVMVNFTNPLKALDGDSDLIADDFEKHIAKQLLDTYPDPKPWSSTLQAGLLVGNLDPNADYTSEGLTMRQISDMIRNLPAANTDAESRFVQQEQTRNLIFGGVDDHTEDDPEEKYKGSFSTSSGIDLVDDGVEVSFSNWTPGYLQARFDAVPWPSEATTDWRDFWSWHYGWSDFAVWEGYNVTEYYASIDAFRQRFMAKSLKHHPFIRHYVRYTKTTPLDENGYPSLTEPTAYSGAEVVTATIPEGKFLSNWIGSETNLVDGYLREVTVVQVNVADNYRSLTSLPTGGNPWSNAEIQKNLPDSFIAWITGNTGLNDTPQMPPLEAQVIFGDEPVKVKWRFECEYRRGNGYRQPYVADFTRPEDRVGIPAASPATYTASMGSSERWKLYEDPQWIAELNTNGFFGGLAKVFLKVENQPEVEVCRFRIGGQNPDEAVARAYIDEHAEPTHWYAYAVAKHETFGRVRGRFYNHFYTDYRQGPIGDYARDMGLAAYAKGWPLYNLDRNVSSGGYVQNGPGGYGMFQLTLGPKTPGGSQASEAFISRSQIWNWQENTDRAIEELGDKRDLAIALENKLENYYTSWPQVDAATYGHLNGREAAVLTYYNGMSGGQIKKVKVTNGTVKSCWEPVRSGTGSGTVRSWRFLQNKENYVQSVNSQIE